MDQLPTSSSYQNPSQGFSSQDDEISLADIVSFLEESWKKLLLAGVAGGVLGLGGWFFLGSYKAELLLQNNGGFDIVSWRATEKTLPSLAAEMLEKKAVPENQVSMYRSLSNPAWWAKNVVINFALSKKEAKDLAAVSEDLDKAASLIQSILVNASARSESQALANAKVASDFLLSGSAYIAIMRLMNDYEGRSIYQAAAVQQKITATEVELGYLTERAKALEQLQRRYPGATGIAQQVVDPKDAGAKYLPLTTQIIAINSDINSNKESLERLNDQLEQVRIYKQFIEGVAPLVVGRYDGLAMIKDFIRVEEQMRAKVPQANTKAIQHLDAIRAQFLEIDVSFRNRLQSTTVASATKTGMIKSGAVGIALAGFAMLALLLGRRALTAVRASQTKQG